MCYQAPVGHSVGMDVDGFDACLQGHGEQQQEQDRVFDMMD